MTQEVLQKEKEMLDKLYEIWNLYMLESNLAVEGLRKVNVDDWPERVMKTHVDSLRASIKDTRSKLKSSRVLLDSLIESYIVYDHVFPKEKPAIQPQPPAASPQPTNEDLERLNCTLRSLFL